MRAPFALRPSAYRRLRRVFGVLSLAMVAAVVVTAFWLDPDRSAGLWKPVALTALAVEGVWLHLPFLDPERTSSRAGGTDTAAGAGRGVEPPGAGPS